MKRGRSIYVYAILILAGLFVLFNGFYLISSLSDLDSLFGSKVPLSNVGDLVFTFLNIIIISVYFYKLYAREPDLLNWTDFGFGYLGFQVILMRIFYIIETKAKISINAVITQGVGPETSFMSYLISLHVFIGVGMLLAIGVVWHSFRRHLKRKGMKEKGLVRKNLPDISLFPDAMKH